MGQIKGGTEANVPNIIPNDEEPPNPETSFKVEILFNDNGKIIYQCPHCGYKSGAAAPKDPTNTYLFAHSFNCPNNNKIPIE